MLLFILLSLLTYVIALQRRNVWTYVRWGNYLSMLLAAAVTLWGLWAPAVTATMMYKIIATVTTVVTLGTNIASGQAPKKRSLGGVVVTNITQFEVPALFKRAAYVITNGTYILQNITGITYSDNATSTSVLLTEHYHPYSDTVRSGVVGSVYGLQLDQLYDRLTWDYVNQDIGDLNRTLYWSSYNTSQDIQKRSQDYEVDWWSYNYRQDENNAAQVVNDMSSGVDYNEALAGLQEVIGQGTVNKYCLAFTDSSQGGYDGIYSNILQGELYFNRYGGIDGPCEDYKDGADCRDEGCDDPQ